MLNLAKQFDNAIGAIFPQLAVKRRVARARLAALDMVEELQQRELGFFRAGEIDRTSGGRVPTLSGNEAYKGDMETVVGRARSAAANTWSGSSIIGAFRRNIVGTGITPRANAYDPYTGDEMEEFNRRANDYFYRWFEEKKYYDLEQVKNGVEFTNLMVDEWKTAGSAFAVKCMDIKRRPGISPLYYAMFEVEDLDTLKLKADNGNRIINGIEVNEYGVKVAYHLLAGGRDDYLSYVVGRKRRSIRVEACQVEHLFRQTRARAVHGVSCFAPVLKEMRAMMHYDDYIRIRARLEACICLILETPGGADVDSVANFGLGGDSGKTDAKTGAPEIALAPGTIQRTKPAEKITLVDPKGSGGVYEPYSNMQYSLIGAGVGLDGANIMRDYTRGSYSAQRQGNNECLKEYDADQALVVSQFLRPQWRDVIEIGIMRGDLVAPGYGEDIALTEAYLASEWQGPARPALDEAKAAAADKINLEIDSETLKRVWNRKGEDFGKQLSQRAREIEMQIRGGTRPNEKKSKHEPNPGKKPDGLSVEDREVYNVLESYFGPEIAETVLRN